MKEELYATIESALEGTGVRPSYVFRKITPVVDKHFRTHETFLVRLCEILKVPYEDTSDEDILAKVKELQREHESFKTIGKIFKDADIHVELTPEFKRKK